MQTELKLNVEKNRFSIGIQEKQSNVRGRDEIEGTIGRVYQRKDDRSEVIRKLEKSHLFLQEAKASQ